MKTVRFYRYMSAINAFRTVRDKSFRCTEINRLNDPYEYLNEREDIAHYKNDLEFLYNYTVENLLTISGSKTKSSTLLWSHYGDSHSGICLGFDVREELVRELEYVSERTHFIDELAKLPKRDDARLELYAKKMYNKKFIDWKYEEELRLFYQKEQCLISEKDGKIEKSYYAKFNDNVRLREIIFGLRYNFETVEKKAWLELAGGEVKLFKAVLSSKHFNMDIVDL